MRRWISFLVTMAGCALGCAHTQTAEERSVNELREELARVQADHDKFDQRLSNLEVKEAEHAPDLAKPDKPKPAPALRVVRLRPDGTEESADPVLNGEDPDDTTARPAIKVQGASTPADRTRGKSVARGTVPPNDVDVTLPDDMPNGGSAGPALRAGSSARPSALDPDAKKAYDAALALVNGKRYPEALDAFAAFLLKWPDHPNADNAMYWRGECYFAQGDFVRAAEQFEATAARFPLGNKAPDALLKLGISQSKLGNQARANDAFDRVQREFPKSEAARRIPK